MKKSEVVGNEYLAKVSGKLQRVRVAGEYRRRSWDSRYGLAVNRICWEAVNVATGRTIVIKSAQRLRPILPRTVINTEATVRIHPIREQGAQGAEEPAK